ncbi:MAG: DUF2254 domain-containing protein [Actinomycetota bacterium]
MRRDKVVEYIKGSLWVVPTLFAVASLALAQIAMNLDRSLELGPGLFTFPGDADSARGILSTIATSMISFTGIVFTITIVALQLASQQFSPRILRTFFEDQKSQYSLGMFVATFIFALAVLRQIGADPEPLPRLAVGLSIALVVLTTIVFVGYLDHMAKSVRISYLIVRIGDETRGVIERFLPSDFSCSADIERRGEPTIVRSTKPGVLNEIHIDRLNSLTTQRGCTVQVLPNLGDFVPTGGKLAVVYGATDVEHEVRTLLDLGKERTMDQDVAFGVRQLVDIAVKAISPAINDPTTAVQSIDQIHDILRRLCGVPLPHRRIYGERVAIHGPTWNGLVNLACNEIRHFGEGYMQVARRLKAMLEDLVQHSTEERHEVLRTELELLEVSAMRGFADEPDRRLATMRDEQGIG